MTANIRISAVFSIALMPCYECEVKALFYSYYGAFLFFIYFLFIFF